MTGAAGLMTLTFLSTSPGQRLFSIHLKFYIYSAEIAVPLRVILIPVFHTWPTPQSPILPCWMASVSCFTSVLQCFRSVSWCVFSGPWCSTSIAWYFMNVSLCCTRVSLCITMFLMFNESHHYRHWCLHYHWSPHRAIGISQSLQGSAITPDWRLDSGTWNTISKGLSCTSSNKLTRGKYQRVPQNLDNPKNVCFFFMGFNIGQLNLYPGVISEPITTEHPHGYWINFVTLSSDVKKMCAGVGKVFFYPPTLLWCQHHASKLYLKEIASWKKKYSPERETF